jgi:hypothetical protein
VTRILEQGTIRFLYRPRGGVDEVRTLADVQRLLVLLEPEGGRRRRELVVGRKRVPDPGEHERYWALVAKVGADPAPGAEVAGEGRYAIVEHDDHAHLVYELERPRTLGPIQRILNIEPEASFVLAVRNEGTETFGRLADVDALDDERTELVLIGASADVESELGIDLVPSG